MRPGKILDEREEERHVLGDELGRVHVAQRAHEKHVLGRSQVVALRAARRAEHRQDVAQPEVVVQLLRELLLAQLVEHVELLAQDGVLAVAGASELDLHDDLTVGHHHGHAAEERLEVLGQLLAAGVAGIHRDEVAHLLVEVDDLAVGELQLLLVRLDGLENDAHLLRDDGEHLEVDAVELVEAAPHTCLGEALDDLTSRAVVHLVAAVGYEHELAERAAHVLGRFGLALAGGARGRAPPRQQPSACERVM